MRTRVHRWLAGFEPRRRELGSERGDVPGWVLVTVMTAGLVMAIWLLADSQLKDVLGHAITSVTKP